MKFECYGASRPQDGGKANEDAFVIGRTGIPFAAICDGAGHAEQAARKVLRLFERFLQETTVAKVLSDDTWTRWINLLDSSIMGQSESTFVGVAAVNNLIVGAYVGDSRAYLLGREMGCDILTADPNKARLGGGEAAALPIRATLKPKDMVLLLSDGAWTPLSLDLVRKIAVTASLTHFSDVPAALLDAAGRSGRADDMTAVALRVL